MNEKRVPETGDVVVLKTGGPLMTVNGFGGDESEREVVWFEGEKLMREDIDIDALEIIEPVIDYQDEEVKWKHAMFIIVVVLIVTCIAYFVGYLIESKK